ncbi:hypothetical protein GCM10028820_33620 [Tessaracoccus terricola]
MAPRGTRLWSAGLLLLLPAMGAWAGAPSAAAAYHDGACTDDTGVTVVVDHKELGGGTIIRCATDFPAQGTALQALQLAGFTAEGTVKDGPGFVCRINGRPAADEPLTVAGSEYRETCIATPPSSAFWSYWHAPAGGDWTFSSIGAARSVQPGGYEGWAFSLNRAQAQEPGVAPAARPDPTPIPSPTAPPPSATPPTTSAAPPTVETSAATTVPPARPSPSAAATSTPAATTAPVTTAAPTPTPTSASPSTPTSAPSQTSTSAPAPSSHVPQEPSASESAVPEAPAADAPGAGTFLGVGAVVLLAAAGSIVWWRRRGAA